jgi:hypothetical protein
MKKTKIKNNSFTNKIKKKFVKKEKKFTKLIKIK